MAAKRWSETACRSFTYETVPDGAAFRNKPGESCRCDLIRDRDARDRDTRARRRDCPLAPIRCNKRLIAGYRNPVEQVHLAGISVAASCWLALLDRVQREKCLRFFRCFEEERPGPFSRHEKHGNMWEAVGRRIVHHILAGRTNWLLVSRSGHRARLCKVDSEASLAYPKWTMPWNLSPRTLFAGLGP